MRNNDTTPTLRRSSSQFHRYHYVIGNRHRYSSTVRKVLDLDLEPYCTVERRHLQSTEGEAAHHHKTSRDHCQAQGHPVSCFLPVYNQRTKTEVSEVDLGKAATECVSDFTNKQCVSEQQEFQTSIKHVRNKTVWVVPLQENNPTQNSLYTSLSLFLSLTIHVSLSLSLWTYFLLHMDEFQVLDLFSSAKVQFMQTQACV